jgi:benzoate-CoA ligase
MSDNAVPQQNLAERLLTPNLNRHPDKTAFLHDDQAISYRQLGDAVYRVASFLRDKGIQRGDRVLLAMLDSPVFIAAFLGTAMVGAIAVPVNTSLSRELFGYIVNDCAARLALLSPAVVDSGFPVDMTPCLVCSEKLAELLPDSPATPVHPEPVQAEDLAYMLYTSGSTGMPKGVPHRHADLLVAAENYAVQVLGMKTDDRVFSASKLFFAYGLGNSLAFPLYVGAAAVLHSGTPMPGTLLPLIERHQPSIFFSVPTVYAQIIRSINQEQLSLPMRLCISAGEALPKTILAEWQRLTGLEILDGIGSTETTHIVISNRQGHACPGSAGQPVSGYEVRLVDDAGADVPSGTIGHLLVRGPGCAPYYFNLPEKSAKTMLPNGFIRTGDVFLEENGFYFHRGRSDDMLKVGGQWVSPVQVEEVLHSHPAVDDCAVAACRVGGLSCVAVHLILQPGISSGQSLEKELRAFVAERLPDYMRPLVYSFVKELPRTTTGKVQRFKLQQ